MNESLELDLAKKIITSHLRRLEPEIVALDDALYRLPAASIRARKPQPGYDQSTRDGFVVSAKSHECFGDSRSFRIVGEIPAGNTAKRRLRDGTACRIMTGALIPDGGVRVVAQEDCRELNGNVHIPDSVMKNRNFCIRRKGCEINKGKVVISAGEPMLPGHLVLLAATGHSVIPVHRRPRVGFFCTGSELVASSAEEEEGLKVSGNHYLLKSLVQLSGGIPEYLGTVADTRRDLAVTFERIDRDATDIILSTGGVGPGKYDLLEEAFVGAGGRVVYRSLHIRPGKSTLFGRLGNSLFFGLPGPPPAVSVLFNELVRPAVLFLLGMKKYRPLEVYASLLCPVVLKEPGVPSFKAAIVDVQEGKYKVCLAEKTEVPDGYIHFPGRRRRYKEGEKVKVHLVGPNLFAG